MGFFFPTKCVVLSMFNKTKHIFSSTIHYENREKQIFLQAPCLLINLTPAYEINNFSQFNWMFSTELVRALFNFSQMIDVMLPTMHINDAY